MSFRATVLAKSDSLLNAVGSLMTVSPESQEYMHAKMAGLLGLPDVNDMKKHIEEAWKETYALKVKTDDLNRKVFKQEALVTGIKSGNDLIRVKEETTKLEELRAQLKITSEDFERATQKAKKMQDELVEAQKTLQG